MTWVYEDKIIDIKDLEWNPELDKKKFRRGKDRTGILGIWKYISALTRSIHKIGLQIPIVVHKKKKGYLVKSGNHRMEALKKLGWTKIPCRIQRSQVNEPV